MLAVRLLHSKSYCYNDLCERRNKYSSFSDMLKVWMERVYFRFYCCCGFYEMKQRFCWSNFILSTDIKWQVISVEFWNDNFIVIDCANHFGWTVERFVLKSFKDCCCNPLEFCSSQPFVGLRLPPCRRAANMDCIRAHIWARNWIMYLMITFTILGLLLAKPAATAAAT